MPLRHHIPSPFDHVQDTEFGHWEFFDTLFGNKVEWNLRTIHLPLVNHDLQITKFMILELIVAGLLLLIFVPLARKARGGALPKGPWWNAFESLLTFVRNEIARPNLGEHEADKYVPFLWTLFTFVLFCNLLGMIPFLGSPTASIWATGALAVCAFAMMHGAAIFKVGPVKYVKGLWPHIDVPYVGWFFSGMIFLIEFMGTFIKAGVLAVRLFANMFAGHAVLAMIMLFIAMAINSGPLLWGSITVASVLGQVALSLLELFVAFLQAYIFVFLTALFMGMALHPQH